MEWSPAHTPDAVVNVMNSTPSVTIEECESSQSASSKSPSLLLQFPRPAPSLCRCGQSLGSTSSLRALDFILPCRPIGSTHPWLQRGRNPSSSARLPHPSGSAFVSHHPGCVTDSRSSSYTLSLQPFGSTRFFLLSGSGSTTVCRGPVSI